MKLGLLISILILTFIAKTDSFGQDSDTLVYEFRDLGGRQDRLPVFYKCSESKRRFSSYDYSNKNRNLKFCISKNLKYPISELKDPIKSISIFSGDSRRYEESFIRRDRYVSIFKLEVDKEGRVMIIETIRHCIDSVSESDLVNTLENTIWKSALKNLEPVISRLLIEIEFDSGLCHYEAWVNKKAGLYRRFPEYRKELMSIYLENGTMWDTWILTPMMDYEDETHLSKAFNSIEEKCNTYIDSLNMVFNTDNKEALDCMDTHKLASKWENEFYTYMQITIKGELNQHKKFEEK